MLARRTCRHRNERGEPCGAAPLKGEEYCLFHHPERREDVQEIRRLGGLRRRKEHTVAGAFDFCELETVEGIRRLLVIAALDTLGLENSATRSRTLVAIAQAALRALQVGELEERVQFLEQAVKGQASELRSLFDQDEDDRADFGEVA